MSDLAWLKKHARSEQDALLVYYVEEGAQLAEAAEKAGYSGGLSDNSEKRKSNYAAAASRALASKRMQALRSAYRVYREHGDVAIAPEQEVLQRLTSILRTSNDGAAITAAKGLLDFFRRASPTVVSPDQVPALVAAACSRDNVLLQTIGIAAGRVWKLALPSMRDWRVPAELEPLAKLMDRSGLSPFEVVNLLLLARGETPTTKNGADQPALEHRKPAADLRELVPAEAAEAREIRAALAGLR